MSEMQHDFTGLVRVQHANGSDIEPQLDPDWDDLTKLQWLCAVVRVDSGLPVRVTAARHQPHQFCAFLGKSTSAGYRTFDECWWFITSASMGAEAMRDSA